MNPETLRDFRERQGLSQAKLADLINGPLGKRYTSSTISRWEKASAPIPGHVSAYLDALAIESDLPDLGTLGGDTGQTFAGPEDTAPGGTDFSPSITVATSGAFTRVCTEMWELIGVTVGMTGAAIGSDSLRKDGEIIDQDKVALGKAYGKLAETNETFRRMLTGMTSGGAWLEVCLVTGGTVGKMWRNHATGGDTGLYAVAPPDDGSGGYGSNGSGDPAAAHIA